jgi:hypothetical protein
MRLAAGKVFFEHQDSRTIKRPLHLGFQFGTHQIFGFWLLYYPKNCFPQAFSTGKFPAHRLPRLHGDHPDAWHLEPNSRIFMR